MENEWLIFWFKLCNVKGIGPVKIKRLFQEFGDIKNIVNSSDKNLLDSLIFTEKNLNDWNQLKNASSENFQKIIDECTENNIKIVPFFSKYYPEKLKKIRDSPMTLFAIGNLLLFKQPSIAIVGSRKSDERAKKWAYTLAKDLVGNGKTIISGGAKGIDFQAHKAALDRNGNTIVVMAPGLLNLYPEDHMSLFSAVKKNGLLISENLPSFTGGRIALLQRNRITSALSDGVVCVTSANGGGSMTQMRHAKEQRIPLFCPRLSFTFKPQEGLMGKKREFKILEIDDAKELISYLGTLNDKTVQSKLI